MTSYLVQCSLGHIVNFRFPSLTFIRKNEQLNILFMITFLQLHVPTHFFEEYVEVTRVVEVLPLGRIKIFELGVFFSTVQTKTKYSRK